MPVVSSICISGVRAMALAAVPTLTGPSTTPSNAKTQKTPERDDYEHELMLA